MKKTPEQISHNMRHVKNRDSQIELALRRELWSRGIHYRKNVNRIFGKPDIAFIGKKVAVFCDSEFWHGYDWDKRKNDLKSNQEFWIPKIERNMQRDNEVTTRLKADGWIVLRFWGNELTKDIVRCADTIEDVLKERTCSHEKF